ncbi:MAG: cell surface protein [Rhodoferax sp.]
MKKNVLALSITAALVGLGFAQSAMAIVTPSGATGSGLAESRNGTGQILLVPYFTTQGSNATLLNIVNTDTRNGKALKVRFRGAANSDDIFDFQVFLSPNDIWAANISQGADGKSKLTIGSNWNGTAYVLDTSCVKPNLADGGVSGRSFVTDRLDPSLTDAQRAEQTREGYVEILNMADIPIVSGTSSLSYITTHRNGVAGCTGTAWTNLDTADLADASAAVTAGLSAPSGGVFANWTIINTANATTFGNAANALTTPAGTVGNIVYWPQTSGTVVNPEWYTADPVLAGGYKGTATVTSAAAIFAQYYDLPDLSTPYTTASTFGSAAGPVAQASALSGSIATTAVMNEYITDSAISAATDWVFSMPTRRYSAAYSYAAASPVYTRLLVDYFTPLNMTLSGKILCYRGSLTTNEANRITAVAWNREEGTPASSTGTVISPSNPSDPGSFCGETSLLSFNVNAPTVSTVLGGTVAVKGLLANQGAYKDGWAKLHTPGYNSAGVPILGSAYTSARGPVTAAGQFVMGATWEHRYQRVAQQQ